MNVFTAVSLEAAGAAVQTVVQGLAIGLPFLLVRALAIVRDIVVRHQGQVAFTDGAVGARIVVTVPVPATAAASAKTTTRSSS